MKIGLCSDHAGVEYKAKLISYLLGKGYEVVNFGTDSTESCDYPDFAHPLGSAVESGECDLGIAICGGLDNIPNILQQISIHLFQLFLLIRRDHMILRINAIQKREPLAQMLIIQGFLLLLKLLIGQYC